jgi:hypothetical protein
VLVSALTGGAVLRITGRIFLGWRPSTGPDPQQARTAEERVPGAVPAVQRAARACSRCADGTELVLLARACNAPIG